MATMERPSCTDPRTTPALIDSVLKYKTTRPIVIGVIANESRNANTALLFETNVNSKTKQTTLVQIDIWITSLLMEKADKRRDRKALAPVTNVNAKYVDHRDSCGDKAV